MIRSINYRGAVLCLLLLVPALSTAADVGLSTGIGGFGYGVFVPIRFESVTVETGISWSGQITHRTQTNDTSSFGRKRNDYRSKGASVALYRHSPVRDAGLYYGIRLGISSSFYEWDYGGNSSRETSTGPEAALLLGLEYPLGDKISARVATGASYYRSETRISEYDVFGTPTTTRSKYDEEGVTIASYLMVTMYF